MAAQAPSRLWYVVAAVILVAGLGAAALLVWRSLGNIGATVQDFARVPVPGAARLQFDEPGGYVLYYEGGDPPALDISVEPVEGGEPVPVVPYVTELTYAWGGRSGVAVASADIPSAGSYVVSVDAPPGAGTLAVGQSITGNIFGSVGAVFAAGGLGLLAIGSATAMILVVALKRSRARAPRHPPPSAPPPAMPRP